MAMRFPLRTALVLVLIAAVSALAFGVIVILGDPDVAKSAPEASTPGTGRVIAPDDASRPSSLPSGASQVDGLPTDFLGDELGAVATAVAATRAQIGFDPNRASAVAAVYAVPAERDVFEDLAQDAVQNRREQAGLTATQEPTAPTAYAATPLAYTVNLVAPNQYAVHLLSWITLTTTSAEVKDHLYVGTQLLTWSGDDWQLTIPTAERRGDLADLQPPATTPGTAGFARAGWVLIEDIKP